MKEPTTTHFLSRPQQWLPPLLRLLQCYCPAQHRHHHQALALVPPPQSQHPIISLCTDSTFTYLISQSKSMHPTPLHHCQLHLYTQQLPLISQQLQHPLLLRLHSVGLLQIIPQPRDTLPQISTSVPQNQVH